MAASAPKTTRNRKLYPALRAIIAGQDRRRHGGPGPYHCVYCRVPSAATLEHRTPLSRKGTSLLANLSNACNRCNTMKGTMTAEEFLADRARWQLVVPGLPGDVRTMLAEEFGWTQRTGRVRTVTVNACLELRGGQVYALVRAHPHDEWRSALLGDEGSPLACERAWKFLKSHYAPSTPKKRRPPRSVFRARARASRRGGE